MGRWHASSKGETREEDAEIDFFLESDGTLKMLSTFKKGSVEWQGTWKASEGAKNQPEKLTIKIAKMLTLDPDGKPSEIQQDGAGSVLNCALTWKGSDEVTLTQQSGVDETGRKVEGKDSTGEVIHFVRVAR